MEIQNKILDRVDHNPAEIQTEYLPATILEPHQPARCDDDDSVGSPPVRNVLVFLSLRYILYWKCLKNRTVKVVAFIKVDTQTCT